VPQLLALSLFLVWDSHLSPSRSRERVIVSRNPNDIPTWNRKVVEYIARVFDFAQMFLASNGVILLFHLDDLKFWRSNLIWKVMALDTDEVGYGEFIATYKQRAPIFQGSISIH
jgi:hypothetical protein